MMPKNSFAIVAIDRAFKELVVLAILYLQSSRIRASSNIDKFYRFNVAITAMGFT